MCSHNQSPVLELQPDGARYTTALTGSLLGLGRAWLPIQARWPRGCALSSSVPVSPIRWRAPAEIQPHMRLAAWTLETAGAARESKVAVP